MWHDCADVFEHNVDHPRLYLTESVTEPEAEQDSPRSAVSMDTTEDLPGTILVMPVGLFLRTSSLLLPEVDCVGVDEWAVHADDAILAPVKHYEPEMEPRGPPQQGERARYGPCRIQPLYVTPRRDSALSEPSFLIETPSPPPPRQPYRSALRQFEYRRQLQGALRECVYSEKFEPVPSWTKPKMDAGESADILTHGREVGEHAEDSLSHVWNEIPQPF